MVSLVRTAAAQPDPHVVIAATDQVLRSPTVVPQDLMSPAVRVRWRRLAHPQDRDDFVAARLLAAEAVRATTGVPGTVRVAQHCPVCGGEDHGAPTVLTHPAVVSWAHCRGVVAAAAVRAGRVGIDVERLDPETLVDPERGVTGRHFVRGEALVKVGVTDVDGMLGMPLGWPFAPGRAMPVHGVAVRDLEDDRLGVIGAVAVSHARSEAVPG